MGERDLFWAILFTGFMVNLFCPQMLAFALSPNATERDKIEAILFMPGMVIPAIAINQLRIDYQKGDF